MVNKSSKKLGNNTSLIKLTLCTVMIFCVSYLGIIFLNKQRDTSGSSQYYSNSLEMIDSMKTILSDSSSCSSSFRNKNAQFDMATQVLDVRNIASGDSVYKIGQNEVSQDNNNTLFIEKMELNGNSLELGVGKGLTLLKVTLSAQESSKEHSTFQIPLHIQTNELGRIDSCFSLGGTGQGRFEQYSEKPWLGVKKGKSSPIFNAIKANASQVVIGANEESNSDASLIIKGALKLGDSKICNTRLTGLLKYSESSDELSWCNEIGQWESLSSDRPFLKEYKDFQLKQNEREVNSLLTDLSFAFCEVYGEVRSIGQCTTRAVSTRSRVGKWELMAQHSRGKELQCSFRCYR